MEYIYVCVCVCVCVYTFPLILLIEPQEYVFVADDSTWSVNIFQLVVYSFKRRHCYTILFTCFNKM